MPTNTRLTLQASSSNSAGGTLTGSWTDVSGYDAGAIIAQITNGATGPTVAAYVDIEAASDNSGTGAVRVCRLTSQLGNSVVTPLVWTLPPGHQWIRSIVAGNTGQAVTAVVFHDGIAR